MSVMQSGHDKIKGYGEGKSILKTDVERIFRQLIMLKALKEVCQRNNGGFFNTYLKV